MIATFNARLSMDEPKPGRPFHFPSTEASKSNGRETSRLKIMKSPSLYTVGFHVDNNAKMLLMCEAIVYLALTM